MRGLVYTISCAHIPFSDSGLFQIYAGTDPQRVKELIPVVCRELRDVIKTVSEAELQRAKAQARAGLLMGQENVMQRADVLGHQLFRLWAAQSPRGKFSPSSRRSRSRK